MSGPRGRLSDEDRRLVVDALDIICGSRDTDKLRALQLTLSKAGFHMETSRERNELVLVNSANGSVILRHTPKGPLPNMSALDFEDSRFMGEVDPEVQLQEEDDKETATEQAEKRYKAKERYSPGWRDARQEYMDGGFERVSVEQYALHRQMIDAELRRRGLDTRELVRGDYDRVIGIPKEVMDKVASELKKREPKQDSRKVLLTSQQLVEMDKEDADINLSRMQDLMREGKAVYDMAKDAWFRVDRGEWDVPDRAAREEARRRMNEFRNHRWGEGNAGWNKAPEWKAPLPETSNDHEIPDVDDTLRALSFELHDNLGETE